MAVYVPIECLSTLYAKLISVVPPFVVVAVARIVAVDNFLEAAKSSLQEVVGSFSLFI